MTLTKMLNEVSYAITKFVINSSGKRNALHWNFFLQSLLLIIVLKYEGNLTLGFQNVNSRACNRSRQILTEIYGHVTDGPGDYPKESHCEWLIKAPSDEQYITLNISQMDTECSYDHLYVYDGDTYNSILLGVFSGKSHPKPITAKSGKMLIMLYSDTNYMREGFFADYYITECPMNCSGIGQCENHHCICEDEQYTGIGCEIELCPDKCGASRNPATGMCVDEIKSQKPYCLCVEGYSGDGCSLRTGSSKGDIWHWVHRDGQVFTPRTSHSTVYIPFLDRLFIFGGYDLNNIMDDLIVYSFIEGNWINLKDGSSAYDSGRQKTNSHRKSEGIPPLQTFYGLKDHLDIEKDIEQAPLPIKLSVNQDKTVPILKSRNGNERRFIRMIQPSKIIHKTVETKVWPAARFGHCSQRLRSDFVFYGGKLSTGEVSSELWLFDTSYEEWILILSPNAHPGEDSNPPPLMYCTLSVVDEEWLYLFGGGLEHGKFSNQMYRINIHKAYVWEKVETYGGNPLHARIVGHSVVFHNATRSLYIYGGIKVNIARFSRLSDQLLVFNVDKQYWSEIHYPKGSGDSQYFPAPLERAFHTALIAGNYMVIYGGYMHKHKEEEACYDQKIYLFHLGCHVWLSPELTPSQEADLNPKLRGVYGHGSFLKHSNIVVVVGGFHGTVSNEVLAYVLPSTLITPEGVPFHRDTACTGHQRQSSCVSNMECGWCATDNTCYGRRSSAKCTTNLQTSTCPGLCPTLYTCQSCTIQGRELCGWCVKTRICQERGSSSGPGQPRCAGGPHQNIQGWWGEKEELILSADQCISRDIPPGLVYTQYRAPVNYSQPDSVTIVADINKDLRRNGDAREPQELQNKDLSQFRLKGFLHSEHMRYMSINKLYQGMEPIRLFLEGYKLNASLYLSPDTSSDNLKEVATIVLGDRFFSEATHIDGELLIPNMSKKQLIQLDFIPLREGTNASLNISVSWGVGSSNYTPLTVQYLEPFNQGGPFCSNYSSCLSCLSDTYCGWCLSLRKCVSRNSSLESLNCPLGHFPIIDTSQCEQCEDYIYCEDCIDTNYCEWIPEKAHCTRKGRYGKAIQETNECPIACHLRPTCTSCLGEPGLCAWCEATKECFLFSLYTSVYQYGGCRVWIDEDHTNVTSLHQSNKLLKKYEEDSLRLKSENVSLQSMSLSTHEFGECHSCESYTSCNSCLSSLECGWCYNQFNPTIGICTKGDFSKPHKGNCSMLMTDVLMKAEQNTSIVFNASDVATSWTYDSCPDVDECLLQLHDCHAKATCVNTPGGFNCTCPKGFLGNGKISCEKTCYETCIHGKCSGKPTFECTCDLGWTGTDCSVNCGCNNHSNCVKVGECKECREETIGDACEYCRPGSYGNATTIGCKKCDCNGHWDETKGKCDQATGSCYCIHNTHGHICNQCLPGFYGDPSKSGRCYRQCTPRGIIENATHGYFGSQSAGNNESDTCLWILSAHNSINPSQADLMGSHVLQVTIEDIEVDCLEGALFIYIGLPDFVSVRPVWDKQNLVGTFCKGHASYPITIEAPTGIMTVFYEKTSAKQGFTASYKVLRCPLPLRLGEAKKHPGELNAMGENRICVNGKPTCKDGLRGVHCDVTVCPGRCNEVDGHGKCDVTYGRCVCHHNYVGEDCGTPNDDHLVILHELFNPLKISSSLSHLRTVLPRFGHTLTVDHIGALWIFGGYSLSRGPLNDIQQFDSRNKTWVQVTVNVHPGSQLPSQPSQRYLHASAYVASYNQMFVYGGMNKTHFLQDFWKFNIATESWTFLQVNENLPGLAGHTLTYKGENVPQSLVLIGGASAESGLLAHVWEYDLSKSIWEKMYTKGAKPIGIFGHSTAFHEPTQTFYVYGGYIYRQNTLILNDLLYAFDYSSQRWSVLPPDGKINHNPASRAAPRAFHSAVTTDEYMVLIGGYISDRLNSNQDLMVYSYKCNMWIPLNNHFITLAGFQLPSPILGVSAALYEDSIYLIGGFAGTVHGSVIEITIPKDLCTLNANKTQCKDRIGCANCVVYQNSGKNTSYCYSNTKSEPKSCLSPKHGKRTSIKGIQCDATLLEDRECYQYKSCAECLASWPAQKKSKQKCQWCLTCPEGKCIPKHSSCLEEKTCGSYIDVFFKGPFEATDVDKCPEFDCAASDCDKCVERYCRWAKQFSSNPSSIKRQSFCTSQTPFNSTGELEIPNGPCPKPCHYHRSCENCLQDNGLSMCHWSPTLRKCLASTLLPLQCLGGSCGNLLMDKEQCPPPCTSYTQCSKCLAQAKCGWCSVDTQVGGLGLCTKGKLDGPWRGRCEELSYGKLAKNQTLMALHILNGSTLVNDMESGERDVKWHYEKCPKENECENRHHTCNLIKEECVNLDEGFQCECANGYTMREEGFCEPVCNQGCEYGTCIKPNNCSCHFGYVGINCSTKCKCNGYSDCEGPDKLSNCIKCHNNTMGQQCEKCKTSFVGNPLKEEPCKSCQEFCYGHTDICLAKEAIPKEVNISVDTGRADLKNLIVIDESTLTDAICTKCTNMTEGNRCDKCKSGYFRGTSNKSAPCRLCQCNGHGSTCDIEWGNNCDCKNNTETPCNGRIRGKDEDKDCWKRQCSKCKEAYFGNPIDGHQCYRQMTLEKEYCLDPTTQSECFQKKPSPLPKGKAMFFAVQPKFNNVDIRLFLDITEGGVDVYLTTFAEGYTVKVNDSSWDHLVEIDTTFPIFENKPYAKIPRHNNFKKYSPRRQDLVGPNSYFNQFSAEEILEELDESRTRMGPKYILHSLNAEGLKTYFTIFNSNHFLVIKNLTDRLVVTLPKQNHNLSEAKFYVVLFGVGSSKHFDSYGLIYFRQDQPRIDLFVFFSVFFSCFFLFLAVCVVVWKVKQGVDQRQARRRHVVEMLHMAKRPFSNVNLVLHVSDSFYYSGPTTELPPDNTSTIWSPARRKRGLKKERTIDKFHVGPIAIEPTEDGVAAVVSVVVQMPGVSAGGGTSNDSPPQRLALGSSLCLVSRICPPTSRRRRTSH